MRDVIVQLSHHAYKQYLDRVETINPLELERQCQDHVTAGRFKVRGHGFIQIEEVWWIQKQDTRHTMKLVTCYGRTSMDLPRAIGWAARNNDRIDLNHMI